MTQSTVFTFRVASFRHVDTPFHKLGYHDYFAVVDTAELPDLSDWRKINVRAPRLTGPVPEAIRDGFRSHPDTFTFMNRGLVLAVQKVEFDNQHSTLTITLSDPDLHGLLDGGHTYNIVMEETENLKEPRYIRVELLEGFNHEGILDVVDARNTSNQVKDQSLMDLAKRFNPLKEALGDVSFARKIAYKEYETDEQDNPKPISIRDVIAILTTFDRDHFNDSLHPIMSYNSKGACLKHFEEYPLSYEKIFPLAADFLQLYDHVKQELPGLYNNVRGQEGNVTGGKFGKLTGVKVYDGKHSAPLYFIDKTTKYGIPDGFVYPVVGAFRALLEEKNGRYVWGKGQKPLELLKGDLGLKLANTIGTFALDNQNPSKVGKSTLVWQNCYQLAQLAYLQA